MKSKNQFQLKVNNGHHEFSFDESQIINLDVIALKENKFHLIDEHESFEAELIESPSESGIPKQYKIKVNGTIHTIEIADQYDMLVDQMGLSTQNLTKVSDIKAPMPGLVLSVKVKVGQEIVAGDQLLILEAMKMENVLKSPGEGVVKAISVSEGEAVEKGQILIELK